MLDYHVAGVEIIAVNEADLRAVAIKDRQSFPHKVVNVDHHHGVTSCILFLHAWFLFLVARPMVRLG
jgi:hypothetical protein